MDQSEYAIWEIGKDKLEELRRTGARERFAKEYMESQPTESRRHTRGLSPAVALMAAVLRVLGAL